MNEQKTAARAMMRADLRSSCVSIAGWHLGWAVLLVAVLCGLAACSSGEGKRTTRSETGSPAWSHLQATWFQEAVSVLRSEDSRSRVPWDRAVAGEAIPVFTLDQGRVQGDVWESIHPEPSQLIVSVMVDSQPVAEYRVEFVEGGGSGRLVEWSLGAEDWRATATGIARVRAALSEPCEVRVIGGGWIAVIGRTGSGHMAALFCVRHFSSYDPRLTVQEQKAYDRIRGNRVYFEAAAEDRIRDAFPLAFQT